MFRSSQKHQSRRQSIDQILGKFKATPSSRRGTTRPATIATSSLHPLAESARPTNSVTKRALDSRKSRSSSSRSSCTAARKLRTTARTRSRPMSATTTRTRTQPVGRSAVSSGTSHMIADRVKRLNVPAVTATTAVTAVTLATEAEKATPRTIFNSKRKPLRRSNARRRPVSARSASKRSSSSVSKKAIDTEQSIEKRAPKGWTKIEKLGSGGFGVVWLCNKQKVGCKSGASRSITKGLKTETFALKQVPKSNGSTSAQAVAAAEREIAAAQLIFHGAVEDRRHKGSGQYLCKLLDVIDTKSDLFLVFERGGKTLTESTFKMKGEFYQGSRSYRIHHLPFFNAVKSPKNAVLKSFMKQLLKACSFISDAGLVHGDIKPDNILIAYDKHSERVAVKLIDFGSSFQAVAPQILGAGCTPEYMPPEILSHLAGQTLSGAPSLSYGSSNLPTSELEVMDMWSVGAVFLELCSGFPLWFNYKSRVVSKGKDYFCTGLFSSSSRGYLNILKKQAKIKARDKFKSTLTQRYPGIKLEPEGVHLLFCMLNWEPEGRITAAEALSHPWFSEIETASTENSPSLANSPTILEAALARDIDALTHKFAEGKLSQQ